MRILLYSTNANCFDPFFMHHYQTPSASFFLEELSKKYPEHKFIVATQFPGFFLIDYEKDKIKYNSENIEYHLIPENLTDSEGISNFLLSLNAEIAISLSIWDPPLDWHCLLDSLIGEKLSSSVKTFCNSKETSMICFDKEKSRNFLIKNGFNVPSGFSIDRELFISQKSLPDIKINVYKDYIKTRLSEIQYPVLVKDVYGLSSFNIDVLKSYSAALNHLESKKMKGNRLVEHYVQGIHGGIEIYGFNQNYKVSDPFFFSVNQYGITSPKQSVKIGPVKSEKYKVSSLKVQMKKLAKLLNVNGSCQVDLVFDGNDWFIIEINPRISGMSEICAQSFGKSVVELAFDNAFNNEFVQNDFVFLDFKTIPVDEETQKNIKERDFVTFISTTFNEKAKQRRECGYTEIIIKGKDKIELLSKMKELKVLYHELIEDSFIEKAEELLKLL